jgi:hypothetical protein
MAPLLVDFQPDTSTQLGPKRVCSSLIFSHNHSTNISQGWTPATFTSSRNERAKKAAMRPEDFMDEEDIQDLKDSRTIVDTTEEMDFLGGTQAELRGKLGEDDSEKECVCANYHNG